MRRRGMRTTSPPVPSVARKPDASFVVGLQARPGAEETAACDGCTAATAIPATKLEISAALAGAAGLCAGKQASKPLAMFPESPKRLKSRTGAVPWPTLRRYKSIMHVVNTGTYSGALVLAPKPRHVTGDGPPRKAARARIAEVLSDRVLP